MKKKFLCWALPLPPARGGAYGDPMRLIPASIRPTLSAAAPWALALAAVLAGGATYAALTRSPPFGQDAGAALWVLNLDLVVLLAIGVLIARRVLRARQSGPGLHTRLIYTFGLLAAVPVVLMTLFSAVFFHFGVQAWLSERVQSAISESRAVAEAYLNEHRRVIAADTLAMARDLDRAGTSLVQDPEALEAFTGTQALLRGLSEALIVDEDGRVLAQAGLTLSLEVVPPDPALLRQADSGGPVLLPTGEDRVRALVRLGPYFGGYLLAGRAVDSKVLEHVAATRAAASDYARLQADYAGLRITITLIYIVVGLLLLMAAMWAGLSFARRLGAPIGALAAAADRVRGGDLTARVPEDIKFAELGALAAAFNRMTRQIERQREELLTANRQAEARRRFTQAVLEGVSSGVLGLDPEGQVTAANAVAARLLNVAEADLLGRRAAEAAPVLVPLLAKGGTAREAVSWAGRHFLVRVAGAEGGGVVVTFDDITDLEAAQRKAAWADVARRIAHEIKNPLTPIQLSAERLKRRYAGQIREGADVFAACVNTIVQHVGDIRRMVDEFSAFARMPAPVLRPAQLAPLVEETLALQRPANPDIEFTFEEHGAVCCACDARQIRQALTNLLQNAVEALHGQPDPRRVLVRLEAQGGRAVLSVKDSGPGLPADGGDLTQPYVTHKPGGTGLGLAIVQKIAQDHGGALDLGRSERLGGARMALVLPALPAHGGAAQK